MRDFNFQNPTRILFGRGQIENIAGQIPAEARILLVAGGGSIRNNGVLDQVKTALEGRTVYEFWGVEPNPQIAGLLPALDIVRNESIDFVLAVGGGSVIDAAKLIAAAARTQAEPWAILAKGARVTGALPLGVVLTLPATGSESNGEAAINFTPSITEPPPTASTKSIDSARTISKAGSNAAMSGLGSTPQNSCRVRPSSAVLT